MTPTVLTVFGTRPEAIKVAPLIRAIESNTTLRSRTVVTAQHREMLDQVNDLFGITPDVDLNIMSQGQTLNGIASRVIGELDAVLESEAPDAVLVQGDTTTVMGASIAAFNRGIPVIHLEAGLRSGNLLSPFPEEANRKLTSQISALHLAPTPRSRDNLVAEGIIPADVVTTGNTVIDALHLAVDMQVAPADPMVADYVATGRPKLLVTTHRRENLGSAMENIGDALAELAAARPEMLILLPAHLDRHSIVGSMGRVGAAGDNAAMESFFALLQKNVLDRHRWATKDQLRIAIVTWIERTYHRRRRQARLGRLTPVEYEAIIEPAALAA
ncbi:non-hydrolyzing UDP-N-acetylglucosamine 2-epimerase [Brevibacterium aurantiacum]|uniref:non-hydrolyzing UDP-N-acetylglucosamine 2-epimerase n=1 Tax=Brevibacterium aurantiacum TaxID=273384 RepID=UPI000F64F824|nr:UDP-N-acetylglucosamine 2-epimerase (non-hydrolyzing) [Brevibacterium aurantiacum]AZL08189.1 UDP-N-acetylglucosamine 2-epimerase (non-hydrolyzing) [Brevibacterium aurantiacum]